jgi:hypothetical protein
VRELAGPRDATATAIDAVLPLWELLDATVDGIRLLRIGILRVGEVGIMVVGIHAEDRQEGAAVHAAEAQQRRPRHPRGGTHLVVAAQPQAQAEEGRRCQGRV